MESTAYRNQRKENPRHPQFLYSPVPAVEGPRGAAQPPEDGNVYLTKAPTVRAPQKGPVCFSVTSLWTLPLSFWSPTWSAGLYFCVSSTTRRKLIMLILFFIFWAGWVKPNAVFLWNLRWGVCVTASWWDGFAFWCSCPCVSWAPPASELSHLNTAQDSPCHTVTTPPPYSVLLSCWLWHLHSCAEI